MIHSVSGTKEHEQSNIPGYSSKEETNNEPSQVERDDELPQWRDKTSFIDKKQVRDKKLKEQNIWSLHLIKTPKMAAEWHIFHLRI